MKSFPSRWNRETLWTEHQDQIPQLQNYGNFSERAISASVFPLKKENREYEKFIFPNIKRISFCASA